MLAPTGVPISIVGASIAGYPYLEAEYEAQERARQGDIRFDHLGAGRVFQPQYRVPVAEIYRDLVADRESIADRGHEVGRPLRVAGADVGAQRQVEVFTHRI